MWGKEEKIFHLVQCVSALSNFVSGEESDVTVKREARAAGAARGEIHSVGYWLLWHSRTCAGGGGEEREGKEPVKVRPNRSPTTVGACVQLLWFSGLLTSPCNATSILLVL